MPAPGTLITFFSVYSHQARGNGCIFHCATTSGREEKSTSLVLLVDCRHVKPLRN